MRSVVFWRQKPLSASAAKNGYDVDHHARVRRIHHDCPINVAPPVSARKHDELALDRNWQRFHLLFPSRGQMPCSVEFLGDARRQAPIPGRIVLADNANVLTPEIAGPRVMVTLIIIVVPVVGLPVFASRFPILVRMFCESWRGGQRAGEQNAECQSHMGLHCHVASWASAVPRISVQQTAVKLNVFSGLTDRKRTA